MEKEHARLGGSSAGRWTRCPGSINACEGLPQKTSTFAEEGGAAHAMAEHGLKHQREITIADAMFLPEELKKYVTEDMIDPVNFYIGVVLDVYGENPMNQLFVEKKFSLEHVHKGMFGTNDAIVLEPIGTMHVFDFKYGRGVAYYAKRNEQGMFYSVGAVHELKQGIVEAVNIVIVQPRKFDYPSTWLISAEDLKDWEVNILAPAAKLASSPDAPLIPGDHCSNYFCDALENAACPALLAKACEILGTDITTVKPTEVNLPEVTGLSSNEISNILNVSGPLMKYLKNVEAVATARLNEGIVVPGRKLVHGKKGNRKWRDEAAVISALKALVGEGAVYAEVVKKVKSPAQMEKLVITAPQRALNLAAADDAEKAMALTEKPAQLKAREKKKLKALVNTLVERAPGQPTMVADTDPRPALEIAVVREDDVSAFDFLKGME